MCNTHACQSLPLSLSFSLFSLSQRNAHKTVNKQREEIIIFDKKTFIPPKLRFCSSTNRRDTRKNKPFHLSFFIKRLPCRAHFFYCFDPQKTTSPQPHPSCFNFRSSTITLNTQPFLRRFRTTVYMFRWNVAPSRTKYNVYVW